jgi:hypothetical protein
METLEERKVKLLRQIEEIKKGIEILVQPEHKKIDLSCYKDSIKYDNASLSREINNN